RSSAGPTCRKVWISLANEDNGLEILDSGCKTGVELQPVEACPLTIKWNPVRTGSILDDVQIRHDGARGILVLPIRGEAQQTVNKDSQAIVLSDTIEVKPISVADLGEGPEPAEPQAARPSPPPAAAPPAIAAPQTGSLEGYKITSLGVNRAVVSGPGGSRVVFDGQETVIGAVLWRVNIKNSAVEFVNATQRILLLFDRSLSSASQSGSSSTNSNRSTNTTSSNNTSNDTSEVN
ncbi:MAG: hypothetical protein AAGB32_02370, partial [Pseudomonadota bacterium]